MGTWIKFLEHVSTFTFKSFNWFCKLAPSAHIRYFCENSMIAHSALVMKGKIEVPWDVRNSKGPET